MSFTLMRYRNGKPEPIKLSIWDAFKGVPPPKPRPHEVSRHYTVRSRGQRFVFTSTNALDDTQCPQCSKFHRPGTKHAAPKLDQPKPETKETAKTSEDTTSTPNEHSFTPGEDAKILSLKAENTTWAKIAEELGNGRTKGMVSHRYKQLKAIEDAQKSEDSTKDKDEAKKPFEQMSKREKKAARAQQAREEALKKKEEAEADAAKTAVVKPDSSPTAVQSNTRTEAAKVPVETNTIHSALNEKQKWIAAASKHFDRTGLRITPEQARKMAEDAS